MTSPPDGMTEALIIKFSLARKYGWTPREVDDMTLEEFFWFPILESAATEAQNMLNRANS